MATFTVEKAVNVEIGGFSFIIAAGATGSCPDDLFDELQASIAAAGTPAGAAANSATLVARDRDTSGVGVEVTNTPSGSGEVLTASSSSAAAWATPSSGADLSDTDPLHPASTADAGNGTESSRDDHVHPITAADVPIADSDGNFTATNVETALAELATAAAGAGDGSESLNIVTSSTSALAVDPADGATQDITLDDDCTFTISNPANSTDAWGMTLYLRQDGTGSRTVTWPDSVTWIGGSAPTLETDADAYDMVALVTVDGGTNWTGIHVGSSGGSTVTTVDAVLSADVSMTTGGSSTWYDGPSASFGVGTWLVMYKALFASGTTGQVNEYAARLWDGTTVYDQTSSSGQATVGSGTLPMEVSGFAIVTLAATTTLKVSGTAIRASATMKRDTVDPAGTEHKATRLVGVKL